MLTNTELLKDRIAVKKYELLTKLAELRAETRADAVEQRQRLQSKLDELEEHVKDGWENLTASVTARLQSWLKN